MKGLMDWMVDMINRCDQLTAWSANAGLVNPISVWLPGLFNPQAFLTAVMQVTARKNEWPLDKLVTVVDVTKKSISETTEAAREGTWRQVLGEAVRRRSGAVRHPCTRRLRDCRVDGAVDVADRTRAPS